MFYAVIFHNGNVSKMSHREAETALDLARIGAGIVGSMTVHFRPADGVIYMETDAGNVPCGVIFRGPYLSGLSPREWERP